jgi:hypothetical protein
MALPIAGDAPTLCIRRASYERSGLARADIDARLGLTADEFRVERDLVVIGPIYDVALNDFFDELEALGLQYFDDYFELPGNWPDWLKLFAASA